jgi:raffinose/stachyose/melibiose transport system substrate-binding protein
MKARVTLAAAMAAVITAAACSGGGGGGSSAGGGGSSVVIWTTSQPASAQKVMADLIAEFNKTYPGGGHVSINWIGGESWKTKMAVAMAAHHPPTIFYTFGGQLLDQYIDAGNVADLTPSLSADPAWKSQYSAKNVFDLATYKDKIYAIPATGPDFELMWQNKAVLAKAGVTDTPTTWDQYTAALAAVKKSGVNPIAIAGKDLWPEMIWMQYLTLRYGGPSVFDRIKAKSPDAWSDPAITKAAETIQQLVKSGYFVDKFNSITFASGQADQLLAAGKAAFQAQLYYDSANMRVYAPKFAASTDYSPLNFPSIPGGAGQANALVGQPAEYYGVSAHATDAQKKEAIAWLKFSTTSSKYNLDFLANNGFTPLTAAGGDALKANSVPNAGLLSQLFDIGTQAPSFQPYWDQDLPSAVITPMLSNIGELFNLSMSPQEFSSRMNKVMQQQK